MHFSIVAAILFPLTVLGTTHVDFYFDTACTQFAGSGFPDENGDAVGGPFGSRSMKFISTDARCSDTCGPNLLWCKNQKCDPSNRADYDVAQIGVCKSFRNGVWASELCGCLP